MMHQICGVLFVSALLWGCSNDSAPTTKTKPAVPVTTTTAKVSNFPVKRTYPAVASSVWKVEIIARVEGWLEARPAPQGSRVEAGDLLFVIQQEPYEASLLAAQADVSHPHTQYCWGLVGEIRFAAPQHRRVRTQSGDRAVDLRP